MNIIGMIGAGPFITLPIMLVGMGGPHILYAWIVGALLALCDGLVYAQFAAALPGSGGPYLYLQEAWRPFGLGRLMAFLFIFQTVLVAPLTVASGAIGFADYAGHFGWTLSPLVHNCLASLVCVLMVALLYRNIESIGRLSMWMLGGVMLTMAWVIVAGLFHFSFHQAFDFPPQAFHLSHDLVTRLGVVSLIAMYNYGGYNNCCYIGDEIHEAPRTLPRAIVLSILVVVALYVVLTMVVLGTVPWNEAAHTSTIASIFIERTVHDPGLAVLAGHWMTGLILFVIAASLYAMILGYSRIPYAAAKQGQFFPVFARVHEEGFPHVSLMAVGLSAIPFCFMSLDRIVSWLILVQIVTQFVWQCAGLLLFTRYRKDVPQPYVMGLYPIPVLLTTVMWLYIFFTAKDGQGFALGFLAVGVAAYLWFARTMPAVAPAEA